MWRIYSNLDPYGTLEILPFVVVDVAIDIS
jgi:hypothetical protein